MVFNIHPGDGFPEGLITISDWLRVPSRQHTAYRTYTGELMGDLCRWGLDGTSSTRNPGCMDHVGVMNAAWELALADPGLNGLVPFLRDYDPGLPHSDYDGGRSRDEALAAIGAAASERVSRARLEVANRIIGDEHCTADRLRQVEAQVVQVRSRLVEGLSGVLDDPNAPEARAALLYDAMPERLLRCVEASQQGPALAEAYATLESLWERSSGTPLSATLHLRYAELDRSLLSGSTDLGAIEAHARRFGAESARPLRDNWKRALLSAMPQRLPQPSASAGLPELEAQSRTLDALRRHGLLFGQYLGPDAEVDAALAALREEAEALQRRLVLGRH